MGRSLTASSAIPSYDALLDSFHRSQRELLQRIIKDLNIPPDGCIADLACGDGFYMELLAEHTSSNALLIGADLNRAYVEEARTRMAARPRNTRTHFVCADAFCLPVAEGQIDFLWCAQSMITLGKPIEVLRAVTHLLRPGARVAVLENDRFHFLLLPWPPRLELAIQRARLAAMRRRRPGAAELDFARTSQRVFRAAGLTPGGRTTYVSDFTGPLTGSALRFVEQYFRLLQEDVVGLEPEQDSQFRDLTDSASPHYMPVQQDFEMCCLSAVCVACRP